MKIDFIENNYHLQTAEMMSLPDDLLAILDEFSDARSEALDHKVTNEPLIGQYYPALLLVNIIQPSYWLFLASSGSFLTSEG